MARLKLIVAYDGADFAGWQSQRHGNTIQDQLERAFAAICGETVRVHGAGRTDAGVHALGQCAHADVTRPRIAPERWIGALNRHLPPAIRILRCTRVRPSFHARYSARAKTYRYVLWNGAVLPPFEHKRAWHVAEALDFGAMSGVLKRFEGEHDFAAFSANRGKPAESTVRSITVARLRRAGPRIIFEFTGSGFLYKMVRLIVGLLVQIGRGAVEGDEVRQRLSNSGARTTRTRLVAPAAGLILVRVRY
jgi:tRNA pseudouridine38-40 synthase